MRTKGETCGVSQMVGWLAVLALWIISSGCCSTPNGRGFVYREWAARMTELGIYPVFPPREDVHVGDVYLLPLHPFDTEIVGVIGGLGMAGIHVNYLRVDTNISVAEYLKDYYAERPTFPAYDPTNESTSGDAAFEKMVISTGGIFDQQPVVRLRQVAFPEFSVTSISEGDLSALIPVEAVLADAGFKYSKVKSVNIKVSAAESYGLSTDWLLRNTLKNFVAVDSQGNSWLKANPEGDQEENIIASMSGPLARSMFTESLTRALATAKRRDLVARIQSSRDVLYLALISEVYYTRSFDITIQHASGRGARARAKVAGTDAVNQLLQGEFESQANTKVSGQNSHASASAATDALALAKELREFNQGFSTGPVGGSVQILSVSETSIGMRRRFERPIAVGVRGVVLRIAAFPQTFKPKDSSTNTIGYRIYLTPEFQTSR